MYKAKNLLRIVCSCFAIVFMSPFIDVSAAWAADINWQGLLEEHFDVVSTFDDLEDWGRTVDTTYCNIQSYPDAFPKKKDGSPSIWQYYTHGNRDNSWIKNHGAENVWRGVGKSMAMDYGYGVDGVGYGPSRMGFRLPKNTVKGWKGDDPADGYHDEVHLFFMTRWFADFFRRVGNDFETHLFLKTLDISAGFRTVYNWGTQEEFDWVENAGGYPQGLHEYGLNAQVYNYHNSDGVECTKIAILTANETNRHYSSVDKVYTDAPVGPQILKDEWFGVEIRIKTSNPHGEANGEFEVWIYDPGGVIVGHQLDAGVINFRDGNTKFNHGWNKFVWGGNRFAGGYCAGGDPLCEFGPVDHFYIDDVIVDGDRIGPSYFNLLLSNARKPEPPEVRIE